VAGGTGAGSTNPPKLTGAAVAGATAGEAAGVTPNEKPANVDLGAAGAWASALPCAEWNDLQLHSRHLHPSVSARLSRYGNQSTFWFSDAQRTYTRPSTGANGCDRCPGLPISNYLLVNPGRSRQTHHRRCHSAVPHSRPW
jgi:hypothetical protein